MSTVDTRALRARVHERAQGRCEYCHLPEEADLVRYEVDHVIAEQHGGETALDNLAYACLDCNRQKGLNIASLDPQTNELTPLFYPRTQKWEEHFRLAANGTIAGLTPVGRATIRLLKLNDFDRAQDRYRLMEIDKYPNPH